MFLGGEHRLELPGNYPISDVVMLIYHHVEIIGEFSLPPIFRITYTIIENYYPGEPINIHIRSLINIILEKNWVLSTKKGRGNLQSFGGNG